MRIKGFILLAVISLAACGELGRAVFAAKTSSKAVEPQTWRLKNGQEWQQVDKGKDSDFMLAVAEAKQLVSSGKTGKAKRAFAKIKKDYPQIAGADYDAYVKAEILYSRRKFADAASFYDKFTDDYPQSSFYQSALEREYQIATAFLSGQKKRVLLVFKLSTTEEGAEIMRRIADKTGDAPIAKNSLLTLAHSNEKRGDYYDAYLAWSDIDSRWPTGQMGKDALLGMARTLEKDYMGPKFDSKVLESSRSYYVEYQKRYESAAAELQIPQKLTVIDEELAEKELLVADYYARTDSYTAANIYYQRILDTWPSSSAGKSAEPKKIVAEKKQQEMLARSLSKKKKFNWKGLFL